MTIRQSTTDLLRRSGLRNTVQRRAVIEWVSDHPHETAEQVYAGVCTRLGTISKQAVYDVLTDCLDVGLIRQIKPAGHPARFERRIGDNHHHLVCRQCGTIRDVDCVVGARPCLSPSSDYGFELDEAEVVFWGYCPSCHGRVCETNEDPDRAKYSSRVPIDG